MPVKKFKSIQFSNTDLQLLTSSIQATLDSITSNPILGGNLLPQVKLAVGSNLVGHGLGRNYVSFLWGNCSAPMRLSYGKSPDPSQFVNVVSDAAGAADVLVL